MNENGFGNGSLEATSVTVRPPLRTAMTALYHCSPTLNSFMRGSIRRTACKESAEHVSSCFSRSRTGNQRETSIGLAQDHEWACIRLVLTA
jgi:hypothetical protein